MKRMQTDDVLLNRETLYKMAESHANRFNLNCLAILCGFVILCEILNNIGVFAVEESLMHICSAVSLILFLLPVLVVLIHDRILEKTPSLTQWPGLKYFIVISIYAGIAMYNVTLTFHAVILLALPPIFAAQYSDQKRLLRLTLFCGILVVPIGVYFGYFYGLTDRNQLYNLVVENGVIILAERYPDSIATRMLQLFFHYVVPRLLGVISINILVSGIAHRNGSMLTKQAVLADRTKTDLGRKNRLQRQVLEELALQIETRGTGNREHINHIRRFVADLLAQMKKDPVFQDQLTDEKIDEIIEAVSLHDTGMIVVSDSILRKPGKLTPDEYEIVKTHCEKGAEIIRNMSSDGEDPSFLQTAEEIALFHHEKWDGSGYPRALKGEEIPLSARVTAVADVYDALISEKAYRKAMNPEDARMVIFSESGSHFDPEIIRVLREIL